MRAARRSAWRFNAWHAADVSGTSRQSDRFVGLRITPIPGASVGDGGGDMDLRPVERHVAPLDGEQLASAHPGTGEDGTRVSNLRVTGLRLGEDRPHLGACRGERFGARRAGPGGILGRVRVDEAPLAGKVERPGEHGCTAADVRRAFPATSHAGVEVLDVLPVEATEADVAETAAVGQLDCRHDLRGGAHGEHRRRRQLDEAGVDRLSVQLEGGRNRAGIRPSGRKSFLVVGDFQPGKGDFGVVTGAVDCARYPAAAAGNWIAGDLDVDPPDAVADREDTAAPPLA